MWIPTEHEKYGVGECSRANFYHAPVLVPTHSLPRSRLQMPGLGIAQRVPGLAAEGRALGSRSPPRTQHASNPVPERWDSSPGLRWRSLERPRGVLRVKLDGEANRVSLGPTHAGPQRQRGSSGLQGFPGVLRETTIPQREHSRTVGRREVPAAGVGIPRVRNVAPAAPVTEGARRQPPSSLASLVSGVCVCVAGGGW